MTDQEISSLFYSLPPDMRDKARNDACVTYKVTDFYDLSPAQRREVYREAVTALV